MATHRPVADPEEDYKDYLDDYSADDIFHNDSNAEILKVYDEIRYNLGYQEYEAEFLIQCSECGNWFYREDDDEDEQFICEDCQEELDENEEEDE